LSVTEINPLIEVEAEAVELPTPAVELPVVVEVGVVGNLTKIIQVAIVISVERRVISHGNAPWVVQISASIAKKRVINLENVLSQKQCLVLTAMRLDICPEIVLSHKRVGVVDVEVAVEGERAEEVVLVIEDL